MSKRWARAAAALLATVALVVVADTGYAVGTGDPQIVEPGATRVPNGYTGPITVDFTNAPADDYEVSIDCQHADYWWDQPVRYDGSPDVRSWTVPPIPGGGECQIVVADMATFGSVGWDSRWFAVSAPPPPPPPAPTPMRIDNVAVAPAKFYPRVRDGFRDTTRMAYRLNQPARVNVAVVNRAGNTVRIARLGRLRGGRHNWQWNGRNRNGELAATGSYRLRVTATSDARRTDRVAQRVTLATGWKTRRVSRTRMGDTGSASTIGDCYVRWTTDGYAELDCWGGRRAQVTYSFALPRSAFDVSWNVYGARDSADICCRGVIRRDGQRVTPRRIRVRAWVTGWRAYEVRFVNVSYKLRERI